jgi:RNA recognition motif-containing protein
MRGETRTKRGIDMAKKIYVGNMSYNTSEDTLRQLFAQYGEVVSVNVITDRYTGRAKGFGFVEMASDDAARAAMGALNGREVDGRQLKVNEANDKPRDNSRGGGGGSKSRYY